MANVSITPRRSIFDRLESWFAAFFKSVREIRTEAELRSKLRDVDDHLLRDMGLTWTGRRYERIGGDEDEWR